MHAQADVLKVRVRNGTVDTVFGAETIAARVGELGGEVAEYYASGELLLIGLLKGMVCAPVGAKAFKNSCANSSSMKL